MRTEGWKWNGREICDYFVDKDEFGGRRENVKEVRVEGRKVMWAK